MIPYLITDSRGERVVYASDREDLAKILEEDRQAFGMSDPPVPDLFPSVVELP